MQKSLNYQKRNRGVSLTHEGLQKLQAARRQSEFDNNFGKRYSLEDISQMTSLDILTIRKVLNCSKGVDKRTLEYLFAAFKIHLEESDYSNSNSTVRQDWGEAVSVSDFYGRNEDISILEEWLLKDNCKLVAILGMGGIGKTSLSIKLMQKISNKFDCIIWRSLKYSPSIHTVLDDIIQFLVDDHKYEINLEITVNEKISLLLNCLKKQRCLLILDNVETLLRVGCPCGQYIDGYNEYSELFSRIGESEHQSCLVITAREKLKEIALMEGENFPVRVFQIKGLGKLESKKILKSKSLKGSEDKFDILAEWYNGNPLALKIVGSTIQDLFNGYIDEFLQHEMTVFGDIRDLLDQHFERLSDIEKDIMYWLAINQEPVSISELSHDLISPIPKITLIETLESLRRRFLIEHSDSYFTLQSVLMDYVICRFTQVISEEIINQEFSLFNNYALIKATAKDYVREHQNHLILQPIINKLKLVFRGKNNLEKHLFKILKNLRNTYHLNVGYTAGNVLNILCYLGADLREYDFSSLTILQADLRNINLKKANFHGANLQNSSFSETFSGIMSLAFDPKGNFMAGGDSTGNIHLWKISDQKRIFILRGHTSWVVSLAFSHDGKMLVSGSSDCTVKLWNMTDNYCLKTWNDHTGEVWSVAFSPDGEFIASGSDDNTIRLRRVSTGKCLKIFTGHRSWVTSLAFTGDGKMLFSSSDDHTIKLWNIYTGKCLRIYQGHCDGIRSISLSPDGQILASGSEDCTIKLWNVSTGECLETLDGHTNRIFSVSFSPRGDLLASGSHDYTVRLWEIKTAQCVKVFQEHSNWVFAVAFNPKGDLLASGSQDQTLKLTDVKTRLCCKTFHGYSNQVLALAFSPDSQILASGGHDRTIKLWQINSSEPVTSLVGHGNLVYSVAIAPKGDILASGSGDKTIKLWDIKTGQNLNTLKGHQGTIRSIAFQPDGCTLASGSEDNTIRLWNLSTGQVLRVLAGHEAAIWSIAFSPNSPIIASGAWEETIRLWNFQTGECIKTLGGHKSWVWSVAFSADGNMLASSSPDGTIRLWSVRSGTCIKVLSLPTGWALSLAFSPDGQTLVSSNHDMTLKLWSLKTYECTKTFAGHTRNWIWSVVFDPTGELLASGCEDETIRIWDVRSGKNLRILKTEDIYSGTKFTDVSGITEATRSSLQALGAII
ncbi:MAG: NB-ARC domain-containing protein [Calothrix sp. MO_192.B10]|nr:NB-ARC domain-containing protein [Calothrix sp. MO_192.B10]